MVDRVNKEMLEPNCNPAGIILYNGQIVEFKLSVASV